MSDLPPSCQNCDGRKCMACCFREVHDECADDCPDCCPRLPVGSSPVHDTHCDTVLIGVVAGCDCGADDTTAPVPVAGNIPGVKMCNAETLSGQVCCWAVHSGDYHSWNKSDRCIAQMGYKNCGLTQEQHKAGMHLFTTPPPIPADLRAAVGRLISAADWVSKYMMASNRSKFALDHYITAVAEVRRLMGETK